MHRGDELHRFPNLAHALQSMHDFYKLRKQISNCVQFPEPTKHISPAYIFYSTSLPVLGSAPLGQQLQITFVANLESR